MGCHCASCRRWYGNEMDDRRLKTRVTFWLAVKLGLLVEELPESAEKSADYIVEDGAESILIELKERKRLECQVALERGLNFWRKDGGAASTYTRPLKQAALQLEASARRLGCDSLRVAMWVLPRIHSRILLPQLVRSLYGMRAVHSKGDFEVKECLLAGPSAFVTYRAGIDAVLLSGHSGDGVIPKLCLNHLSPRAARLRQSRFATRLSVFDPLVAADRGEIYLVEPTNGGDWEGHAREQIHARYGKEVLSFVDPIHRLAEPPASAERPLPRDVGSVGTQ